MNTIPTTFKDIPAYTAVGGLERRNSSGVSIAVLSRGAPYHRASFFEELGKQGFDFVISLEGNHRRYDLDGLSASFPFVRFILPSTEITRGEEINIACVESSSPLFMVIWDDLRIMRGNAERIVERFQSAESSCDKKQKLCVVPAIQNAGLETMPTLIAPLAIQGRMNTHPFIPEDGRPSLFPFDGIGVYDRESFLSLGGFDRNMNSFYWQLLDFGFRAHLWGEEITAASQIKLTYEGTVTPEDISSLEDCYRRFYLKNIAPVFRGDYAHLPFRRFPGFLRRLKGDFLTAWEEFSLIRSWVKTNRYRFKCDARSVTELWDDMNEGVET